MKNIFINFVFFLILTFTLFSCKKDFYPNISEASNVKVDELEEEDLGPELLNSWQSNTMPHVYSFYSDNTYTETYYLNINIDTINLSRKGNYQIADGYIYFSNVQLTYDLGSDDPNTLAHFSYLSPQMTISQTENEMILTDVKILTPVENNIQNEITGKWNTSKIITAYDSEQSPQYVTGTLNEQFEFIPETHNYNRINIYQAGSFSQNDTLPPSLYDYVNQTVTLVDIYENYEVSFVQENMIWHGFTETFVKIE